MLNPHVLPFSAYPGLAPELSARSGQGGWDGYALAAPADRLLPFVLTRLLVPGNSAWLNCATLVHADTDEVLFTLTPTGQTAGGPGALGLVLAKVVDRVNLREHFIYYGAIIPNLAMPCGVPVRLVLDNAFQSARFVGYPDLSDYQKLEWSHPGPLSGIPYGTGLVQRFYGRNGGLQYAPPREVQVSTQDASTGNLRVDYTATYGRRTTTLEPLPRYLADAVAGARTHASFTVDGQAYRLAELPKETAAGQDGGRWTLQLTLEDPEPLQGRPACPPAPLVPEAFDPVADAPRRWVCGDASDTAPDFRATGNTACELADGRNTGYVLRETKDRNPYSPSFGQVRSVRVQDLAACPVVEPFLSKAYGEVANKNNCPDGTLGSLELYGFAKGRFTSYESQEAADALIVAYVQAGKQAHANEVGVCSSANPDNYEARYSPNGCFSGFMVNRNDQTDQRSATEEEYRLYRSRDTGSDGAECPLPN